MSLRGGLGPLESDAVSHALNLDLSAVRHIHILGICGTAMGAFAGLLVDLGYEVTGSDAGIYPPMSTQLKARGIPLFEGYSPENLSRRPDLVIVGNVIPRVNIEAQAMTEADIPYMSMPEALGRLFLPGKTPLVVAGTHGKTTTTSLLAWTLHSARQAPSFFIGGELQDFGKNAHFGEGPHFVIEGDEYDTAYFDKGPKFLHYQPAHAIMTSVEFDHADIYRDLAHVQESFRRFLRILPPQGSAFICTDYPALSELIPETNAQVETYGLKGDPTWTGRISDVGPEGMALEVIKGGEVVLSLKSPMTGDHNLLNIVAVAGLCLKLGLAPEAIQEGIASFGGVKRRQEIIAEVGGVTILDDFAHHPTAVAVTTQGVKARYGSRRLWAIFEPRSNSSRRNIFQDKYGESFAAADRVIISRPKNLAKIPLEERMDGDALAEAITKNGTPAIAMEDGQAIAAYLAEEAKAGDVILLMSNGGFDGIYEALPEALENKGALGA